MPTSISNERLEALHKKLNQLRDDFSDVLRSHQMPGALFYAFYNPHGEGYAPGAGWEATIFPLTAENAPKVIKDFLERAALYLSEMPADYTFKQTMTIPKETT